VDAEFALEFFDRSSATGSPTFWTASTDSAPPARCPTSSASPRRRDLAEPDHRGAADLASIERRWCGGRDGLRGLRSAS